MAEQLSVFDITGMPADDFIEEISNTQAVKKSELLFALFVEGLAGEPDFGVGIADLIGEHNTLNLRQQLESKLERISEFVDNVAYGGSAIEQDMSNQVFAADLHFTESESAEELMIPVGFSTES